MCLLIEIVPEEQKIVKHASRQFFMSEWGKLRFYQNTLSLGKTSQCVYVCVYVLKSKMSF